METNPTKLLPLQTSPAQVLSYNKSMFPLPRQPLRFSSQNLWTVVSASGSQSYEISRALLSPFKNRNFKLLQTLSPRNYITKCFYQVCCGGNFYRLDYIHWQVQKLYSSTTQNLQGGGWGSDGTSAMREQS